MTGWKGWTARAVGRSVAAELRRSHLPMRLATRCSVPLSAWPKEPRQNRPFSAATPAEVAKATLGKRRAAPAHPSRSRKPRRLYVVEQIPDCSRDSIVSFQNRMLPTRNRRSGFADAHARVEYV